MGNELNIEFSKELHRATIDIKKCYPQRKYKSNDTVMKKNRKQMLVWEG
jgi:hypothetical protein